MAGIGVFGFGQVGRTLCRQAVERHVKLGAIADSSGLVGFKVPEGLSMQVLSQYSQAKESGKSLLQAYDELGADDKNTYAVASSGLQSWMSDKNNKFTAVADCSAYDSPQPYVSQNSLL